MARFLLAWEFGSGLGHAGRLAPIGQTLVDQGHQVDMAFKDIVHARTMVKDPSVRLFQSPLWLHRTVGLPQPQVSLAEILLGAGWLHPQSLEALVRGWMALIEACGSNVVVTDYAPTAILAAHILNKPTASVGIGFYVPPDEHPLPPFRTWEPIAPGRVAHHDQQALASANAVIAQWGGRPLERLSTLFRGQCPLLCTWEELDHHRRGPLPEGQQYLGPSMSPATGEDPIWPDGDGPRVFAYIRHGHPDHLAVLQALAQEGCRTLVYMPEVAAGQPAPFQSPRIRYSQGPVNLDKALPGCAFMVSHGGAGAMTQSLLAGVPSLLLPAQAEQFLICMRMHEHGAGINVPQTPRPPAFRHMIRQLLDSPRHREAAQNLARKYASFNHTQQMQQIAQALTHLAA
jgi:UDP:flavonoid glycosyltransferase YjiC (YdhE family)